MAKQIEINHIKCDKCNGHGWLWWDELEVYKGPAKETGEDDTRYTCDKCKGKKYLIKDPIIEIINNTLYPPDGVCNYLSTAQQIIQDLKDNGYNIVLED